MSEETKNDLANAQQQVTALLDELRALSAAAVRRWKISAWTFGILCAVIALYLGYVYSWARENTKPEAMIEIGLQMLQDPKYGDQAIQLAKDSVPDVMERISPFLDDIKRKLPGQAEQLAESLKADIDKNMAAVDRQLDQLRPALKSMSAKLVAHLTAESNVDLYSAQFKTMLSGALPQVRGQLFAALRGRVKIPDEELRQTIGKTVAAILEHHEGNMRNLVESDDLYHALQAEFAVALDPILTEYLEGVKIALDEIRKELDSTLKNKDDLDIEQKLYLRWIQLWKTYFNIRMEELDVPA